MNVFICVSFNPYCRDEASANRWLTLIEGIASLGAKVHLFILGGFSSMQERQIFGVQGERGSIYYEYLLPVVVQGYWQMRYFNYLGYFVRDRGVKKVLMERLKFKFGIVWTDSSLLGFSIAVKVKSHNAQLKTFVEMSEFLDIHRFNKGNLLQRWKGDVRKLFFENVAFSAYDGIALMTYTLMKHYQSFPKPQPKFLHLPMTVDLSRFNQITEPLPEFKTPYIAFVGVMNDAKDGVSNLIRAFEAIKQEFPSHSVYLVGVWNYDTPIHLKLIKEFDLEKRVFWMKEYSRDLIPKIICNADLLVLPRPDSKQARGGFPTKLGEYLATGKPVCATRVGELSDYLTDNESVFFAEPGSIESFAEVMERALGDYDYAKKVGANGRKVAELQFNKNVQARKLMGFLEQLNEHA